MITIEERCHRYCTNGIDYAISYDSFGKPVKNGAECLTCGGKGTVPVKVMVNAHVERNMGDHAEAYWNGVDVDENMTLKEFCEKYLNKDRNHSVLAVCLAREYKPDAY